MQEQKNKTYTQGIGRRPGPLDGLLIADFSRVLAGPYCTMLLGDPGATVIKVESPGEDDTRSWMPPERHGVATYYLAINRNKRSLVFNFTDPTDLQLAHELAARSDVFIENFKPGGLKCFGLDEEGITFAHQIGLDPVVEFGTGKDAVPMIRHPISFSLTPPRHEMPPPTLGQDNEQVRAWLSKTPRTDPEKREIVPG